MCAELLPWIMRAILMASLFATACEAGIAVQRDARIADASGDGAIAGGPMIVYAGGGDDRIHVFDLDGQTLALTPAGTALTGAGPSFLAFDPARRWLVAVNENADAVESFAIASGTGALARIDGASSQGSGPAHVSIDRTGAWVMVANYGDGSAAVLPIAANGMFGAATATVAPGANAHEIVTDGANAIAYVPCLGTDRIVTYGFDVTHGTLAAKSPGVAPAGAGPRHIVTSGTHAWVVNEKQSSITTYAIAADGTLTAQGTVSSRAAGATGANTGAEIQLAPSGKWLYVSNRGDDDIGQYAIASDGALSAVAHVSTGGTTPRHFSIVPGGAAMLIANMGDGTITGMTIDASTGALTPKGVLADVTGVEFVQALQIP